MIWLWRLDVVRLAALAVPGLLVHRILIQRADFAGGRGWTWAVLAVLALALPVFVVAARRFRPRTLGVEFLVLFFLFSLFFAVVGGTRVLEGERRMLASYETVVPGRLLGVGRLGDWRYRLFPPSRPAHDLVVILLPSSGAQTRVRMRQTFKYLIDQAVAEGARGVAFDYYLEQPSPFDRQLVRAIEAASSANVPVVFGFRQEVVDGLLVPRPPPPSLTSVLSWDRLGHIAAYLDGDGVVRMVPTTLPGSGDRPSLSQRMAAILASDASLARPRRLDTAEALLAFVRPNGGLATRSFDPQRDWSILSNRLVLVGTEAPADRVLTPYGPAQGVEVHGWAAHALRDGAVVHRLDPSWQFALVYGLGVLLTVAYARGRGVKVVWVHAARLAVATIVLAVVLAALGRVWLDIGYALIGLVTLAALLSGGRAIHGRRPAMARPAVVEPVDEVEVDGTGPAAPLPAAPLPAAPGPAAPGPAAPGPAAPESAMPLPAATHAGEVSCDVFLSHNVKDKPAVRALASALRARGLDPWVDEDRLLPGRPWQELLEQAIANARSAAVLVGPDGLGPWEIPEMRACLSQCVRRGMPVIPVLLPGAPGFPYLPLFLTECTGIDLRDGFETEGIDRLVWGITGRKPSEQAGET